MVDFETLIDFIETIQLLSFFEILHCADFDNFIKGLEVFLSIMLILYINSQ